MKKKFFIDIFSIQAVDTLVAGILHDVVDDTCESLHAIEEEFGDDVAKLVAGVSRLSYVNQVWPRTRMLYFFPLFGRGEPKRKIESE